MALDQTIVSTALAPYIAVLNNTLAKTLKEGDPAEVRQALSVISNQAGAFSDHPLLNQGIRSKLSTQVKAGLILMKTGVDDAQLAEFVRLSTTTVTAKELEEAGINPAYITEKLLHNSNADHLTLAEKTELSKIIGITIKAQGSESWLFTPLWGAGDRPSTDIIGAIFPKAPPPTVGFVQGLSSQAYSKTPPLIRSLHFGASQVRAYDSSHQGSLNKGLSWHINNTPKVRNALIAMHSFTKRVGAGELDKESTFYKNFKARHEWTSKELEVEIVPNKMEEGKGLHTVYLGYTDGEGFFSKTQRYSFTLTDKELMEIAHKGTTMLQAKRRGK
jgi:hypothetical protein